MINDKLYKEVFNLIYPVGSIYISVNNTNPSTLFGGTWEQIKDTFLLSAGDTYSAGSTGGEATHTLTVAEMPSHNHTFQSNYPNGSKNLGAINTRVKSSNAATSFDNLGGLEVTGGMQKDVAIGGFTLSNTGSGNAHNNMPPYLAVYMWKRTA